MAQVPLWATQLVKEVAIYKKRSKLPRLQWRISQKSNYYHGFYRRGYKTWGTIRRTKHIKPLISITVGKDLDEKMQKGILLHELSHWLAPKKAGHSKKFWLILKELMLQFDSYHEDLIAKEVLYKKKAALYL